MGKFFLRNVLKQVLRSDRIDYSGLCIKLTVILVGHLAWTSPLPSQPRHLALPGDAWGEALPHALENHDEAEPLGDCNKAEPCYKKYGNIRVK